MSKWIIYIVISLVIITGILFFYRYSNTIFGLQSLQSSSALKQTSTQVDQQLSYDFLKWLYSHTDKPIKGLRKQVVLLNIGGTDGTPQIWSHSIGSGWDNEQISISTNASEENQTPDFVAASKGSMAIGGAGGNKDRIHIEWATKYATFVTHDKNVDFTYWLPSYHLKPHGDRASNKTYSDTREDEAFWAVTGKDGKISVTWAYDTTSKSPLGDWKIKVTNFNEIPTDWIKEFLDDPRFSHWKSNCCAKRHEMTNDNIILQMCENSNYKYDSSKDNTMTGECDTFMEKEWCAKSEDAITRPECACYTSYPMPDGPEKTLFDYFQKQTIKIPKKCVFGLCSTQGYLGRDQTKQSCPKICTNIVNVDANGRSYVNIDNVKMVVNCGKDGITIGKADENADGGKGDGGKGDGDKGDGGKGDGDKGDGGKGDGDKGDGGKGDGGKGDGGKGDARNKNLIILSVILSIVMMVTFVMFKIYLAN